MDDKEFRKLKREDLIEIIYQYQRREQRMQQELESLRTQLEDRNIRVQKAGSIAEAALALNGVFEAAQKAADQYLLTIHNAAVKAQAGISVPAQKMSVNSVAPGEDTAPQKPLKQQEPVQQKYTDVPSAERTAAKPAADMPGTAAPEAAASEAAEKKISNNRKIQRAEVPAAKTAEDQVSGSRAVQNPAASAAGKPGARHVPPVRQTAKPEPQQSQVDDTDAFIDSLKDFLGM